MSRVAAPLTERPRERLLSQGAAALSDAELVALFVGRGIGGGGTVSHARALIERFGRLSRLLSASPGELDAWAGARPGRHARIGAVMELARRALAEEMKARDSLASPAAVRAYLRLRMQDLGHECFFCVFLDAQNRVIAAEELFRGTLTQTSVYPYVVRPNAQLQL